MMISEAIAIQTGCTIAEGAANVWFVDSKGLVSYYGGQINRDVLSAVITKLNLYSHQQLLPHNRCSIP